MTYYIVVRVRDGLFMDEFGRWWKGHVRAHRWRYRDTAIKNARRYSSEPCDIYSWNSYWEKLRPSATVTDGEGKLEGTGGPDDSDPPMVPRQPGKLVDL